MDITEADEYARLIIIDFLRDDAIWHLTDVASDAIQQDIPGSDADRLTFYDAVYEILGQRLAAILKQVQGE